ncbi:MAG: hypothetical protein IT371_25975 [Deltaproteobacteria bacterium]|nr:hypothetical protein [Deltaproteobacteria bacterium]
MRNTGRLGAALALLLAACGTERVVADLGTTGTAGGACYPNGTCNAGLACGADRRCASLDGGVPVRDGAASIVDGPPGSCAPGKDSDGDGLGDLVEGCAQRRDSDADGLPDYLDGDSDGDGVSDAIEGGASGAAGAPRDTDQDGYPDYVDLDSDGDGLPDAVEDRNGDGRVGCCRATCGEKLAGCPDVAAGACAAGQSCEQGACKPVAALACARGESSAVAVDTFGLGTDRLVGNGICDASQASLEVKRDTDADLALAVSGKPTWQKVSIAGVGKETAAFCVDYAGADGAVAGVVAIAPTTAKTLEEAFPQVLNALASLAAVDPGPAPSPGAPPPTPSPKLQLRSQPAASKTHDGLPLYAGALLDITLKDATDPSTARARILAALLGLPGGALTGLPAPFGVPTDGYLVRLSLVLRADGRVAYVVAVTPRAQFEDPTKRTAALSLELADGSALAAAAAKLGRGCEGQVVEKAPMLDLIWVGDESGSMYERLKKLQLGLPAVLAGLAASGIDFRVGVTNLIDPNGTGGSKAGVGKFCSVATTNQSDDGGPDRFLAANELATIAGCVANPPGYEGGSEYGLTNALEAIKRHLPRADGDPTKLRKGAEVAILVVSDEMSNELSKVISYNEARRCPLAPDKTSQLATIVQPFLDAFTGKSDPETRATFYVVGATCADASGCDGMGADVPYGYQEVMAATGGAQVTLCGDVVANVRAALEKMLRQLKPILLEGRPITSSLRVTLDGKELVRGGSPGFAFEAGSGALRFVGLTLKKGSRIVVSYQTWTK